ncbi:hypothetical protein CL689_04465 [Candidatus Saccharibacteria bacterium]|nr:hypothetical protein [Candidatus Saccharibacteria bacterium]|tara:strand:- start:3058 stop:4065 length:1008 start_codon:yes stop_codon:yes gene_type:complete
MYNTSHRPKLVGGIIAIVVSLLLVFAGGWLFFNRQFVRDQLSVWSYEPSAQIVEINDRARFTDEGTFHFYATHPEIASAEVFNQDCPRQEPNSPILGCYASGRIYIYDVTNEQLNGIEEVTAAHEMLHAVWERTSEEEKARLTVLLEAAYDRNKSAELEERMAYYDRNQPGEVVNELHSILPTEVADIGDELEAYYQKYFTDRQAVVAMHQGYSGVFKDLVSRADALYAELQTTGAQIEQASTAYDQSVAQLTADIESFNARAASGGFSSMAQFNAERAELVARSTQLENDRSALEQQVAAYNQKYDEYQQIGSQIEALNRSIDSIAGPQEAPSL